jgi:glycosyltransferase involved in cell wall biosynthesis
LKAFVIHHILNSFGGESSFAIETISCLARLGYEIELITAQKPDLELLHARYGKKVTIKNVKYISPFKMNYLGIYQKLLTTLSSINVEPWDIVINTNGNILPLSLNQNVLCILYIHFPAILLTNSEYSNIKYKNRIFWRAYFKPYQIISHMLTKKALKRANLVFTNSRFSQDAIKKVYPNADPHVIYPPVDTQRFSNCIYSNSRENQVLVICRFSPEKQIEKTIFIARILKNIKFIIMGSLLKTNYSYFKYIQQMIRDYGLTNIVKLMPNASEDEMLDAMSNSMIYLHTMKGEHFGISIVEAMGAGLITIVPSFGGCSEIVPSEYHYNTIKEAADCISKNITEYDSTKRQFLVNIAKQFSPENFRHSIKSHIEAAYYHNTTLQKQETFSMFR